MGSGNVWRTSRKERVLLGAEAALMRESMAFMWATIEEEAHGRADHWPFGVPVFDRLTCQQQLAMLADVGEALFREDVPAPELTAVNEGTIGAMFANIRQRIEIEIDDEWLRDGKSMRQFVLEAIREVDKEPPPVFEKLPDAESSAPLPDAECDDTDEWDLLVEVLESFILWDADWLDEELYVDDDPRTNSLCKYQMGVADGYYTAIAPDPTEHELIDVRRRLHVLLPGE
jgi:hypothetical protein